MGSFSFTINAARFEMVAEYARVEVCPTPQNLELESTPAVVASPSSLPFRYTFEEAAAARRIQAAWAGLQGRRAFRDQLAKQSIRGLGIACINEASSHAWIGHEEVRTVTRSRY